MNDRDRTAALARLAPVVARAQQNEGWDFAHLGVRVVGAAPGADAATGLPWDYIGRARELAASASRVLDLGTGGGERLAEIADGIGARFVATEQWHVNGPIAARRLARLGIPVVRAAAERTLPFAADTFDLVLSRHEGFDPAEVIRVLAPGGCFLNQQVGRENWPEFAAHFPRKTDWGDHGTRYANDFRHAGFAVQFTQAAYRVAYRRLEDFLYMVAAVPWDLPDFDLESDLDAWLAFGKACTSPEGLVVTEVRYLMEAHAPARG